MIGQKVLHYKILSKLGEGGMGVVYKAIMITEKGQVKIMDFGLAKIRGGAQLTKDQSTLGTAAYMSPEQAEGTEADHRWF